MVAGVDELPILPRLDVIGALAKDKDSTPFCIDMDGKPGGLQSTAAGRYQLLSRYWKPYCELLGLNNFSKEAQDRIAIQQIKERRAIALILTGDIVAAIDRCRNIWASFPGAGYGQHENMMENLLLVFAKAGGVQ